MTIHVEGLDELIARMGKYPAKVKRSLRETIVYSLLAIHDSVPSYPPPPAESDYVRTGTLGRTLTVGGEGNLFDVKESGDYMTGEFGTNLDYAPFVIGEDTQAEQNRHWWTLQGTVLGKALSKIEGAFQTLADELAAFLAGKGG